MKNAVIYVRHSTEEADNQISACEAYAKANNLKVLKFYQDYDKKRPQWQTLMQDAKTRNFDCVVCYNYDRISRKLKDIINYHDTLMEYGIDLQTAIIRNDYLFLQLI